MAESTPLTHDEERVLQAVARLEAGDDTATIRRVADETDLDPHRAEAILGELATSHDMIREVRTELDADATGVGRQYAVKKGPAPRT
jgi:hypothetical protein